MKYTLGTAAKATGKSRTAILRAISSGKMSAPKDENGHYQIDPAELFRVYSAVNVNSSYAIEKEQYATLKDEKTTKLIEVLESTIDDLRRRLDNSERARDEAAAETRRLNLMLTHQPEAKPEPAPTKSGLLQRLWRGKPPT